MKKLTVVFTFLLLTSCAPTLGTKFSTPGFGVISQPISKAKDAAVRAGQNSKIIFNDGALPKSELSKSVVDDLTAVITHLNTAQSEVNKKEVEIEKLTKATNDLVVKSNKLVMEGERANKAIWRRNFIILGLGLWALKTPLLFVAKWVMKLFGLAALGI